MIGDLFAGDPKIDEDSPIFAAYKEWDAANPHFYPLFVRFSRQLAARGYRNIGVALIFERIRWESMIRTTETDEYKLNNNFRSIYARRFMADYPELNGFFRTRKLLSIKEKEVEAA